MKIKNVTMKLEVQEKFKKEKTTVMVYGMPHFEDKQIMHDLFSTVINKGVKVGQKIEAWKIYDTSCSFRLAKVVNNNLLHFQAC